MQNLFHRDSITKKMRSLQDQFFSEISQQALIIFARNNVPLSLLFTDSISQAKYFFSSENDP